jgi:hypothetical protein
MPPENEDTESVQSGPRLALQYIDYSRYYMVYGIVTLIILLLLLWFFVKTTAYEYNSEYANVQHGYKCNCIRCNRNKYEGMVENNKREFTDVGYKNGPLDKGLYGDTVVYFYKTKDNLYANKWKDINKGIYVHNSKTYWEDVNTPLESIWWS